MLSHAMLSWGECFVSESQRLIFNVPSNRPLMIGAIGRHFINWKKSFEISSVTLCKRCFVSCDSHAQSVLRMLLFSSELVHFETFEIICNQNVWPLLCNLVWPIDQLICARFCPTQKLLIVNSLSVYWIVFYQFEQKIFSIQLTDSISLRMRYKNSQTLNVHYSFISLGYFKPPQILTLQNPKIANWLMNFVESKFAQWSHSIFIHSEHLMMILRALCVCIHWGSLSAAKLSLQPTDARKFEAMKLNREVIVHLHKSLDEISLKCKLNYLRMWRLWSTLVCLYIDHAAPDMNINIVEEKLNGKLFTINWMRIRMKKKTKTLTNNSGGMNLRRNMGQIICLKTLKCDYMFRIRKWGNSNRYQHMQWCYCTHSARQWLRCDGWLFWLKFKTLCEWNMKYKILDGSNELWSNNN